MSKALERYLLLRLLAVNELQQHLLNNMRKMKPPTEQNEDEKKGDDDEV